MSTEDGDTSRMNPKTRVKFVKQDPIVVPKPSLIWFSLTALSDVESSGREVPTAIIVAPMIDPAMPRIDAMFDAESTTNFELMMVSIKPAIKRNNVFFKPKVNLNFISFTSCSSNLISPRVIFPLMEYRLNTKNKTNKAIPVIFPREVEIKNMIRMILQRNNIKASFINVFSAILTGRINPTNPMIKHMFAMFDPRRLPMEIPISPDIIAVVETIISGKVLATERSMKPIVNSPSLVILAILTEDLTTT